MDQVDNGLMIEAPVSVSGIQSAYDLWSVLYGFIAVPMERTPRLRGLELAAIQPQDGKPMVLTLLPSEEAQA